MLLGEMREFKNETIIVNKETWIFLRNYERTTQGFAELTERQIERIWSMVYRNGGADPKTHPIAEDEVRIDKDTFGIRWSTIRSLITDNGFTYREDGFVVEGIYI